ncbi:hypothetical protein Trydic_g11468 [Trypoxylus dichotomus]
MIENNRCTTCNTVGGLDHIFSDFEKHYQACCSVYDSIAADAEAPFNLQHEARNKAQARLKCDDPAGSCEPLKFSDERVKRREDEHRCRCGLNSEESVCGIHLANL